MATNLPFCFFIQFLEQLLKFLANFTLLKYVKSQTSYGFLITKKLIFGFQILDSKVHFSASLTTLQWAGKREIRFSSWLLLFSMTAHSQSFVEKVPLVSPFSSKVSHNWTEHTAVILAVQRNYLGHPSNKEAFVTHQVGF